MKILTAPLDCLIDDALPTRNIFRGQYGVEYLYLSTTLTCGKAILAMPFFAEYPWMKNVKRMWIWVILTLPTTALAVTFYYVYTRKNLSIRKVPEDIDSDIELSRIDSHEEGLNE